MKLPKWHRDKHSTSLTVHECNLFKEVIGPIFLKGPFKPYISDMHFNSNQKTFGKLSSSQFQMFWSIRPHILMTGTIIQPIHPNKSDSENLNRLKQCLCDLRGKSLVGWELIFNWKQDITESFEKYAENMFWRVFWCWMQQSNSFGITSWTCTAPRSASAHV